MLHRDVGVVLDEAVFVREDVIARATDASNQFQLPWQSVHQMRMLHKLGIWMHRKVCLSMQQVEPELVHED